ncbi:MAG: hypothetical protein ACJ72O_14685 [Marmoricola sp.]
MSIHQIRPTVIAATECPEGHLDRVEAINPVVRNGELVEGAWPSAYDFCMECDLPVQVISIEVQR